MTWDATGLQFSVCHGLGWRVLAFLRAVEGLVYLKPCGLEADVDAGDVKGEGRSSCNLSPPFCKAWSVQPGFDHFQTLNRKVALKQKLSEVGVCSSVCAPCILGSSPRAPQLPASRV